MAPFRFNELGSDIRRIIWKHALLQASAERIVIMDNPPTNECFPRNSLRVLPFRSLVSPILAVNQESRSCAFDYYNLILPVISLDQMPKSLWKYTDEERAFLYNNEEYENIGYEEGYVFLNLQQDIFLSGFFLNAIDDIKPFFTEWCLTPSSAFHTTTPDEVNLQVRHFTRSIWPERERIQKVLSVWCTDPYDDLLNPRRVPGETRLFNKVQKDLYWEKETYAYATRYFYWPNVQRLNVGGLMQHLFERGPGKPLRPQYQLKELISIKLKEGVTYKNNFIWLGMGEYLADPSQEEEQHRPRPRHTNAINNDYAWKKMDSLVKEMTHWIDLANRKLS
ncbi:hypothetical protein F5Y00DRAFT_260497 [Daldinia vernicosa]|uniref:uncharacterized protein n=1 Tax=Daldinia vernicosa TaxID=114800 RepID=UPI002008338F|nr:uncharacterized protein F5Y00DRAFT_260497 [Daldinia vernicosa]KAI0850624.1 hypothetical protein F5Y00DRAFT_260497 [Daldinia vernicosa]